MTSTEIPERPTVRLVPVANGSEERWSTTTFEGEDGKTYMKKSRLVLGSHSPYACKWFILED